MVGRQNSCHNFFFRKEKTEMTKIKHLYSPFRALGYITDHVPICIQQRGQTFAITTSIGSTFHIYDGEKLSLLFVGQPSDQKINAMACFKDLTFCARGSEIFVYKRSKFVFYITYNPSRFIN